MKQNPILILGWHQIYLSSNAGGYVRLKEFLKRIPNALDVVLLDNKPTLFKGDMSSSKIVIYDTPNFIKGLRKYFFLIWLLLETIAAGFYVYKTADKLIKEGAYKAIYVPIGEFPQLYLPGVMLKKKYPKLKLVVDILNFELPDKNAFSYFRKLRANGVGFLRSFITIMMFYIGYLLIVKTIKHVDYIFTVSKELVTSIKKIYKSSSIDFTPSGVDSKRYFSSTVKKYDAIYIGRVNINKGLTDMIDTWSLVVSKKKNATLCIVGYIDLALYEHVKQDLKKRNLEKNIVFKGQVSDEEKVKLLAESQIFLHLARYEPLFPVIGILEGLASGLYTLVYTMPVVASQMKLIKSVKAIEVVENGNSKEVADKIIGFMLSSNKNKQAVTTAAKKFANLYDWNIIAAKEFNIIKQLVAVTA